MDVKSKKTVRYIGQTISLPKTFLEKHQEESKQCLRAKPCCGMMHHPMCLEAFEGTSADKTFLYTLK